MFAAGFTTCAKDLRVRLDCFLHGVACEEPDGKIAQECNMKHCKTMKSIMTHLASCDEFRLCSNPLCVLFSPLFLHWKKCCGPCPVCGPVNMKYNKKKLLQKIELAAAESEVVSEEVDSDQNVGNYHTTGQMIEDNVLGEETNAEAAHYLRKYL